jgi:endonuclease/exonuclease/phosphatase family metal-dependent hydrolase
MPFYDRPFLTRHPSGVRTLERLLALRRRLDDPVHGVPQRTQEETLLLATWNIRDFDKPTFGKRSEEAMHYIAEVVARFDLVAIQEVYRNLEALERLMKLLGGNWKYIVTDTGEGSAANDERFAFVYDTRKVRFAGLAGEVVLPPVVIDGERRPPRQLARTPYICGFRSGWTDFVLCTVHILYGSGSANHPERVEEIRQIARFMKDRSTDPAAWSQNVVVLGDFNIFSRDDITMQALTDQGFVIPEELQKIPGTNVPKNKHYDQIAFRVRPGRLDTTGRAGVFDVFNVVYRDEDEALYVDEMGDAYHTTSDGAPRQNPGLYYRTHWRTHQISDHLPMWIELRINYTDAYLERLHTEATGGG